MIKHIAAGFALAVSLAAPAAAQAVKEISLGILSTESNQNLKQDWQPLLADMEKRTGMKVNAFFAPDYAGIIEAMRFGKVQVAWMGNKSGIEAVDRAGAEVFAQVVNADGSIGYHSLVSVHRDSPHKSIEDVLRNARSLSFGLGDPNSTSGSLVPGYYLFARHNVDPKSAFKAVRGANHEVNIMAVANRQVDAAVHSSDASMNTRRGRVTRLRAICRRCCMPPEYVPGRSSMRPVSSSTRSIQRSASPRSWP